MNVLRKLMEEISALRAKLAALKAEHRAAKIEIEAAEKDLDGIVKAIPSVKAEIETATKDAAENPSFSPILAEKQKCLSDLEEEEKARKGRLDSLKESEASRQADRLSLRESLAKTRDEVRKECDRLISSATTNAELDEIETALADLSLPLNRVRVKREYIAA